MIEVIAREKTQAPPPWVVWESLNDHRLPVGRPWLHLLDDEILPRVLRATRPDLVVWSSLWPARRDDQIRFDIRSDGLSGSRVRWTLLADGAPPEASVRSHLRYRLNTLINGQLRASFDQ
jgi:hypothetical protein